MTAPTLSSRMRSRVTIQAPVEAQDEFNEPIVTWTDVATVWAEIIPAAGREVFDLLTTRTELPVRVRIRYRSGLTPKHRLVSRGRVWDIQAVVPDAGERRRELELVAVERQPEKA